MTNIKSALRVIHRRVAIVLTPLWAIVIITGAILAFKPMLAPTYSNAPLGQNAEKVVKTLTDLENKGVTVNGFAIDKDGKSVWISGDKKSLDRYSLDTGEFIEKASSNAKFFNTVKKLHKELMINAGGTVEVASWLMVIISIGGIFIAIGAARLKRGMKWHRILGLVLIPLVIMLPLTGGLMDLVKNGHKMESNTPVLSVTDSFDKLRSLGRLQDLVRVDMMKRSKSWVLSNGGGKNANYLVSEKGIKKTEVKIPLVKSLHEGTWGGFYSGLFNFLIALMLVFFTWTGFASWSRRRREIREAVAASSQALSNAGGTLVAHGSQTGTARNLARETQKRINEAGGKATLVSMAALKPENLKNFQKTIFFCSTAGEGELPDEATRFVKELEGKPAGFLNGVDVAVFALGDRTHGHFCEGGRKLEKELARTGATFLVPMGEGDGAKTGDDWSSWMDNYAQKTGEKWKAAKGGFSTVDEKPHKAKLVARKSQTREGSNCRECQSLTFSLEPKGEFRAGDLFVVTPPGDDRARLYSIGSDSRFDDEITLTVSLETHKNAQGEWEYGKTSSWLLHDLKEGEEIDVKVRRHPDFNLPDRGKESVIMVAAGSGVAPLVGFPKLLKSQGRRGWLIFGNSKTNGDDYHREMWERALKDGSIERLDWVFDDETQGYAQGALLANAKEVKKWIDEGALVYVCGRAATLGRGVEDALAKILGGDEGAAKGAEKLAKLKAEGRVRMDLFG